MKHLFSVNHSLSQLHGSGPLLSFSNFLIKLLCLLSLLFVCCLFVKDKQDPRCLTDHQHLYRKTLRNLSSDEEHTRTKVKSDCRKSDMVLEGHTLFDHPCLQ